MADRHVVVPRTMCFVFNGKKVLLLKAKPGEERDGFYDPLGGHIEKGESVIDCANREIQEESGLVVKNTKLRGIVHVNGFYGKQIMMFVTASRTKRTKVQQSDEGELKWVKFSELNKIKAFEDLKPILKHVIRMKPGEIFVGTSEFDGKDKLVALDIKIS